MGEAIARAGEGLGAVGAAIGPRARVLIDVKLEVLIALEGLVAERTGVWAQIRVGDAVSAQGRVGGVDATAHRAGELHAAVVLLVTDEVRLRLEAISFRFILHLSI